MCVSLASNISEVVAVAHVCGFRCPLLAPSDGAVLTGWFFNATQW